MQIRPAQPGSLDPYPQLSRTRRGNLPGLHLDAFGTVPDDALVGPCAVLCFWCPSAHAYAPLVTLRAVEAHILLTSPGAWQTDIGTFPAGIRWPPLPRLLP